VVRALAEINGPLIGRGLIPFPFCLDVDEFFISLSDSAEPASAPRYNPGRCVTISRDTI
jgi:hypothetical protein